MSVVLTPVTDRFSSPRTGYAKRNPRRVGHSRSGGLLAVCRQHAKKSADVIAAGVVTTCLISTVIWIIGVSVGPLQSAIFELETMHPRQLLHVLAGM